MASINLNQGSLLSMLGGLAGRKQKRDAANQATVMEMMKAGFLPPQGEAAVGGGIMEKLSSAFQQPELTDPTQFTAAPYHKGNVGLAGHQTTKDVTEMGTGSAEKIAKWQLGSEENRARWRNAIFQQEADTREQDVKNRFDISVRELNHKETALEIETELRREGIQIDRDRLTYDQETGQFFAQTSDGTVVVHNVHTGETIQTDLKSAEINRLQTRAVLALKSLQEMKTPPEADDDEIEVQQKLVNTLLLEMGKVQQGSADGDANTLIDEGIGGDPTADENLMQTLIDGFRQMPLEPGERNWEPSRGGFPWPSTGEGLHQTSPVLNDLVSRRPQNVDLLRALSPGAGYRSNLFGLQIPRVLPY